MADRLVRLPVRLPTLLAVFCIGFGGAAIADDSDSSFMKEVVGQPSPTSPSFEFVRWEGSGVTQAVKGKTTVILSFVTNCEVCNDWVPDLLAQLKKSSEDKPIVILAIASNVSFAEAKAFITARGMSGPNVLYGSSTKICETFGLNPNFNWNYVWIDPKGAIKQRGRVNAAYELDNVRHFVIPSDLSGYKNYGLLDYATPEMSPAIKDLAWQMDLGQLSVLTKLTRLKNSHTLSKADQETLTDISSRFIDDQLTSIRELAAGDVPARIEAFERASMIATQIPTEPEGKEAGKTAAEISKDPAFSKELASKKLYVSMALKADSDQSPIQKLMRIVVDRYPDTYYGNLARERVDASPSANNAANGGAAPN